MLRNLIIMMVVSSYLHAVLFGCCCRKRHRGDRQQILHDQEAPISENDDIFVPRHRMTDVEEQAFQRLHERGFSSNQDLLKIARANKKHKVEICKGLMQILRAYEDSATGSFLVIKLYPLDRDGIPLYLMKSRETVCLSKELACSGLYKIKQPGNTNKTIYLYLVGEHYAEAGMRAALEQQPDAQVVRIEQYLSIQPIIF